MGNTSSGPLAPDPVFFEGDSPQALFISGAVYVLPNLKGKGCQLSVLKTASTRLEPPSFTRDTTLAGLGFMGGFALRLTTDPALSLECEGRKFSVGDRVSLWSVDGHPEWAVRWVLNDDGTVSPLNNRDVCLGLNSGTNTPMLVACRR